MSWRSLALFLGGAALSTASWALYARVDISFVRGLLLLLTIVGFVGASIGGGALWLRRVRYVNPDASCPRSLRRRKNDADEPSAAVGRERPGSRPFHLPRPRRRFGAAGAMELTPTPRKAVPGLKPGARGAPGGGRPARHNALARTARVPSPRQGIALRTARTPPDRRSGVFAHRLQDRHALHVLGHREEVARPENRRKSRSEALLPPHLSTTRRPQRQTSVTGG